MRRTRHDGSHATGDGAVLRVAEASHAGMRVPERKRAGPGVPGDPLDAEPPLQWGDGSSQRRILA